MRDHEAGPPLAMFHHFRWVPGQIGYDGFRPLEHGHPIPVEGMPIWVFKDLDGWKANSVVVEGDDGWLVIDTGCCSEQGAAVARELAKLSDKPVAGIIYSHHHGDHCHGTDSLIDPAAAASGAVPVIAWHTFHREYHDENIVVGPVMGLRAMYMFGALIDAAGNPRLLPDPDSGHIEQYVPPNTLIDRDTEFEISGIRFTVFHTGGEAGTEVGVHFTDMGAVFLADEVYEALPNLYTLRGARHRDAIAWAEALDKALAIEGIDVMLGAHISPVYGREEITRILETYRDAILYIHDQAIRQIGSGATPAELRTMAGTLPAGLQLKPWTAGVYGTIAHNAAAQFTGYLGWFGGDATELLPIPIPERARRTIALMGGRPAVVAASQATLAEGDAQWCAELCTMLLSADNEDVEAAGLKAAAFRRLAEAEGNRTWRRWYLTAAHELEGTIDREALTRSVWEVAMSPALPATALADALRYRVDPELASERSVTVRLEIDQGPTLTLLLRNAVLRIVEGDRPGSHPVRMGRPALADLAAGVTSYEELVAAGDVTGDGVVAAAALFEALDTTNTAIRLHDR